MKKSINIWEKKKQPAVVLLKLKEFVLIWVRSQETLPLNMSNFTDSPDIRRAERSCKLLVATCEKRHQQFQKCPWLSAWHSPDITVELLGRNRATLSPTLRNCESLKINHHYENPWKTTNRHPSSLATLILNAWLALHHPEAPEAKGPWKSHRLPPPGLKGSDRPESPPGKVGLRLEHVGKLIGRFWVGSE